MKDCIHTRGKSCVQRLKYLQDLAAVHNLKIIDNSQPSCKTAAWILVRTHQQEVVRITYTWENKIEANAQIPGLPMVPLPQTKGGKSRYEILI